MVWKKQVVAVALSDVRVVGVEGVEQEVGLVFLQPYATGFMGNVVSAWKSTCENNTSAM